MIFGKYKERVGTALTILALTGLSCFFAGLSLGLYLTRPGGSLPTTLEGTVDTPTTEPTVEFTPEPTSTPSLVPTLASTPMSGGEVRLHTGCGQNTATDIYWCKEGYAVWNNNGDTVFLLDGSGSLASEYSY